MNNEKIEILFEEISKSLDALNATPKEEGSSAINQKVEMELQRLDGVESGQVTINGNLINLGTRFKKLEEVVREWKPVHKTDLTVEHVFFPGILEWLNSFKNRAIQLSLLVLLIFSFILNVTWYQKMNLYEVGFLKYYLIDHEDESYQDVEYAFEKDHDRLLQYSDSIYYHNIELEKLEEEKIRLKERERELQGK